MEYGHHRGQFPIYGFIRAVETKVHRIRTQMYVYLFLMKYIGVGLLTAYQ